jgi:hypothetical protein
MRHTHKILIRKLDGKGLPGRRTSKYMILNGSETNGVRECALESPDSGQVPVACPCEYDSERSNSVKRGEFLA